nr:capsid protein [Betapartitivirus sp.]
MANNLEDNVLPGVQPPVPAGPSDPPDEKPVKDDPKPRVILPLRHNKGKPLSKPKKSALNVPTTKSHSSNHLSYFKSLDIHRELETDIARNFTIDVQSDLRFTFSYIMSTTQQEFKNYDPKGYPFISIPSVVAYKQIMLHAVYLLNDLHSRDITSHNALPYQEQGLRRDFLNAIGSFQVPPDIAQLVYQIHNVYDPNRPNHQLIATFAGASLPHDYGRIMSPWICFTAHDALITYRTTRNVNRILNRIYNTQISRSGNQVYTIGKILGSPYTLARNHYDHPNWLRDRFELMIDDQIGSSLEFNPTYCEFEVSSHDVPQETNIYDYLLGYSEKISTTILMALSEISSYYARSDAKTTHLFAALNKSCGLTLLTHSIESPTLPTWHYLTIPPVDAAPIARTDEEFASDIKFLATKPVFKGTNPPPNVNAEASLYLVSSDPYDPKKPPFPLDSFYLNHVSPAVLWHQPYAKIPAILSYSLTLGIKIEQANIDGLVIPTPNNKASLNDNNSLYLQGSLPLRFIKNYIADGANANALRLDERRQLHHLFQPLGIGFNHGRSNTLPQYFRTGIANLINPMYGLVTVSNFNDNRNAFTYCAWSKKSPPKLPPDYTYLWSSYRYVQYSNLPTKEIHMYYSLRGLYGLNGCLSKSVHPTRLLPY